MMKRVLCGLLAAALLWACLPGCVPQSGSDTEPMATTEPTATAGSTTVPTTESIIPEGSTAPTGILTPGENVTSPDNMPEKPDNDYSLPPDEGPGGRSETSKY